MSVIELITELTQQDIRLWLEDGNLRYSAPDGAMTPTVIGQLRSAKSDIINFLQQSEAARATSLPLADRSRPLPVSHAQQRLWFIHQLDPANTAYHIHVALNVEGDLDAGLLGQACSEIVRRHEILRTRYEQQGGQLFQVVMPPFPVTITPEAIEASALPQALHDELHTPFDLGGQVFRVRLWQLAPTAFALSFTIHHIAADGWSLGIFVNELVQLYVSLSQGNPSPLPELPRQYADYAAWQQQDSQRQEQQLAYWKGKLAGTPNLSLPYDAPPSTYISNEGSSCATRLDLATLEKLQQLNRVSGTTLFMSLTAALAVLMHRYSQQDDFCIGTPVAGRQVSQLEPMIGCFLNVLAIRCQPQPGQTFTDFLQAVKSTCTEAFAYQDVPFERIVQEVVQERDLAISPLFQVLLSLQNAPVAATTLPGGLSITPLHDTEAAAQFDLKLTVNEESDGLVLFFEYRKALFRDDTISRLAGHFVTLLKLVVAQSDVPIESLCFLSDAELAQQMDSHTGWNATRFDYPETSALHALVEAQVAATPGALAVADAQHCLNYAELNRAANRLAHYLQTLGVGRNTPVAVCLERSVDMSVALLAILKAGGCYVPLATDIPLERLRYIVQDTQAKAFISSTAMDIGSDITCPRLVITEPATWASYPDANLPAVNAGTDIFNLIYTSGSTGNPKGVMVPHQGIINRLRWMQHEYALTPADRIAQKTPYNFDVSVWELFWPLLTGSSIHYAKPEGHKDPEYLRDFLIDNAITVLHFVPSMLGLFLQTDAIERCTSVRLVFTSGEALQLEHNEGFFARLPQAQLHNLYGPTEASIDVSYYACHPHETRRSVPIGKPIHNTQLHIFDRQLQPLPVGAAGELYIGGIGLALGYWNQSELTAKTFIDNPWHAQGHPSRKLYKTGDVARYLPDGNIEYLGRNDHQVKVRGFRIELGEIESRLRQLPAVEDCMVISRTINGSTQLVAYFLAGEPVPSTANLRHQLLQQLPQYMIPACFMALESWPLSANGKIDRKALPEPDWSQMSSRPYVAPASDTQIKLAAIWSEVLGVEKIGIQDSFFELGGHSLSATQVLSLAQEAFAVEVPLRQIFENPTIEAIAELIDTALVEKAVFNNQAVADDDDDAESFIL